MKTTIALTACLLAVGVLAAGPAGADEHGNSHGAMFHLVAGGHGPGGGSGGSGMGRSFGGTGGSGMMPGPTFRSGIGSSNFGGSVQVQPSINSGPMFRGQSSGISPMHVGDHHDGDHHDGDHHDGDHHNGSHWYYHPTYGWGWWGGGYPYYGYSDYGYYGYPYSGYSAGYGGDVGPAMTPNSQPATAPVLIVNPSNTGVPLSFVVSGQTYSLQPGFQQQLNVTQGTTIQFDRGAGRGTATYSLTPGVYNFAAANQGWELFKQPAPSSQPGPQGGPTPIGGPMPGAQPVQ